MGEIIKSENISSNVLARVNDMKKNDGLTIPQGYSVSNALNSAWLLLQNTKDKNGKAALSVCTQNSIANSLLDMVIQGLSPAKKQCYFMVYGTEMSCFRSYHGTQAALKRLNGVEEVYAQVIYKDDVFEYTIVNGNKVITKHEQKLANVDNEKIIGAYCIIVKNDTAFTEIMTKKQIDVSWSKRSNAGAVQKEFPEEMCKRTVINRAAKRYVNTSDDSDIICEAINRSTESEYAQENAERKTIEENANKEVIEMQDYAIEEVVDDEPEVLDDTSKPSF